MSGEPVTIVEKAVSTLKVRDLLRVTLTRWTSFISLTKTPLEEPRRSAAPARSAEPDKVSAAPRAVTLRARSLPPALLEIRPALIRSPSPRFTSVPVNLRPQRPNNSPSRTTKQSLQAVPIQ